MATIVHVTHEAVHKAGGIGSVLEGLITSSVYGKRIARTILLGALPDPGDREPLGSDGTVLYDNWNGVWSDEVGTALSGVEVRRQVRLVYGRRPMTGPAGTVEPEVLLVDASNAPYGLNGFKGNLFERFGLRCDRYEGDWEFEQYVRIAEPGYEAVTALLSEEEYPCFLIAHEFMGLGTAFKAILAGDRRFATVFYAHEVATVRRLVEDSPGRDVMFYNVLKCAGASSQRLDDVFGSQDDFFKHALVRRAWHCDGVFAVGDWVVEELRFLGSEFGRRDIDLVYNGLPATQISLRAKKESRHRLTDYAETLLGIRFDFVFTHVSRLVVSKGLWRDLLVLQHLDKSLAQRGQTALLIVLASDAGHRDAASVEDMVTSYEWPVVHRQGYPDLTGSEVEFHLKVQAFNSRARSIKILFVNQFGWDQASCGPSMPKRMEFADLRRGGDVEFGQSLYEPFGIAQLEPLPFGSISALSDACGCVGLLQRAFESTNGGTALEPFTASHGQRSSGETDHVRAWSNFITADYTGFDGTALDLTQARAIGADAIDRVESSTSAQVAETLAHVLPACDAHTEALMQTGYNAAAAMSWDCIVEGYFFPALKRIRTGPRLA